MTVVIPTVAMEPLTAPELVAACKAYQAGGASKTNTENAGASSCKGFIQGYVSASTEIVDEEDRPSAFVTRAMRTRTSRFSEEAEQRLSSRYCLPKSESVDVLIAKVANISQPFAENETAESVIVQVLESHYRCEDVLKK
ncbi:Rap1a/Tai family immunity protein [Microbulbifer celer]|uniref:Rap1a/Tai family immunity protein n=2 Tax=Microbulbifer TaxID=48073 RepID=A0ABW3UAY2_9GAMM|nr:Rap1a/Tai family immunity protein [Microbulbifer celer]UFN57586.1 hypothetical protein LPW13_00645 [Microbulbifer celer]